ncbi:Phosphoglycerate mutase-like protein [Mycena kentingensis (nom. inval.)]|nr:Phosphoglycerate mutase-like protein [Mycena kentingensis (nom. inval.)]
MSSSELSRRTSTPAAEEEQDASRPSTIHPRATPKTRSRWFCRVGSGVLSDIRARAPFYVSDWLDAWNYRVVPATALIFFANVLPGIAFSLDLIETTAEYGVSEVLMSSFMAAFIFSFFGAQPLTIAGVTGPITVFNKTIYDILQKRADAPVYLHFIGWVYLWAAIMHWITAVLNFCNLLKYVTLFPCDTFGFYVAWVYLQYGVQVITRQLNADVQNAPGPLVSIILALLMLVTAFLFQYASTQPYFYRHARRFLADYGMPISLIATSAMAYWGRFNAANAPTLPVGGAFQAAGGRQWLVKFWEMDGKWVGIAFPFGFVLWVLFFFDHNVSSLMAQGAEFPLRKPPGFHWDFFLLGITTFIAGLVGLPAPNGLIPQAPIHTTSLLIMKHIPPEKDEDAEKQAHLDPRDYTERPIAVVEQRVSNLAQGALCLVLLTGPFLHVLSLIPRGVLAGLFWYMGVNALQGNGITLKLLYFLRDRKLTLPNDPLRKVRRGHLLLFVAVQLVGFGATFAITQTTAAIGFPVVIMLLVPLRVWGVPRLGFTPEELAILDGPTASPFVSIAPFKIFLSELNCVLVDDGVGTQQKSTFAMATDGTLLGVLVLTRHGDRQGFYQDPKTYAVTGTTITPLGTQQTYQLGSLLRARYLNASSPLNIAGMNDTLVDQNQIHVRADAGGELGVIYDSAVAVLQGLYPANRSYNTSLANGTDVTGALGGYQYIPIESVEPTNDVSLEGYTLCGAFNDATTAFYASPEFAAKKTETADFLAKLPQYLDGRPVTLENMYNIFDFMNVQSIHNAAFFDALPPTYLEQARHLANWHEYGVFTSSSLSGIGNIAGRAILPGILSNLRSIANASDPLKFAYQSLAYKPFLSLFNMTGVAQAYPDLAGMVNYAAAVAIEVRQSGDEPTVRLNFRNGTGDFVTYNLLGASGDVKLSELAAHVSPALINTTAQWCSACDNSQDRGCGALTQAAAAALASADASSGGGGSHQPISPVGAGFLGAGLTLAVLLAMFGVLVFLGMLTIGRGSKKGHKGSIHSEEKA